jgi:hypothetical protein
VISPLQAFESEVLHIFHFCARYLSRPSSPWCHRPNILWKVQTMELFMMQFSPASCHFTHCRCTILGSDSWKNWSDRGIPVVYCMLKISRMLHRTTFPCEDIISRKTCSPIIPQILANTSHIAVNPDFGECRKENTTY